MKISQKEKDKMYEILQEEIPNSEASTIACYNSVNRIVKLLEGDNE